ncbi:cupin domain protein [mine drainage metagenome]|uniref:Cupin domain protein n=1 Tax=mine drainage metagenome TaxID=410659 RepID=A0A1J5S9G7_9ZZZZ
MKIILATFLLLFVSFTAKAQYSKDVLIEPVIKTDTTSIGQKIIYPNFLNDEVTILKVTIPPGKSTGWHKHLFPVFAYVMKGTLTVAIENNKTLQLHEGSSFAEVINTFHNGSNNGNENVVLIAFYMGEKGKPLSVLKGTTPSH